MSTKESLLRYFHITNKLRKAPATFNEIDSYLKQHSELQSMNFNVSKRQFKRDLEDIGSIFEIEINYDFKRRVYAIEEELQSEVSRRRLEAFDTFNALKIGENISKAIQFENRRRQGTENIGDNKSENNTQTANSHIDFSDKEIDKAVLLEYKLQSVATGCMALVMIPIGLLLLFLPFIGFIVGPICLLVAFIIFSFPVRGAMLMEKFITPDKYKTLRKQVKLRLESGQLLLIQCPVCNKTIEIKPDIYYQNKAFRCLLCNQDSKRELFRRISW